MNRACCIVLCLLLFASVSAQSLPGESQPLDTQWLTYPGGDGPGKGKRIVLIAAEQEYRSERSMPMMAKTLGTHHCFDCTVLFGVNDRGEVDPTLPIYPEKDKEAELKDHHIPGLEQLDSADLVIFCARLLTLPKPELEQMVKWWTPANPSLPCERRRRVPLSRLREDICIDGQSFCGCQPKDAG